MSEEAFRSHWQHIHEQVIAWGDMDALSHVNNTIYFRYFESARVAFLRELKDLMPSSKVRIGPILAYIDCRFKYPLQYPDTVLIGSRVNEIGGSSLKMSQSVWSASARLVAAESKSVIVLVDYHSGEKVRVPDEVRTGLGFRV